MRFFLNRKLLKIIIIFAISLVHHVRAQGFEWEQALKDELTAMGDSLTIQLKPWSVPDNVFKVEDYGAVSDGEKVNTSAIQAAIDACSAAGGGIVRFTAGDYVTGTLRIKSGVMLEIPQGVRLLGSTRLDDYPEIKEAFKSVMSENHKFRQSLIYAEKADKIGIRGKGEIYFRGERTNFPGPQTTGEIIGRPFGIRMIQCSNVSVRDIFLHNAAAWMQSYIYCKDMIFDGMRVENHANYNNDGLDIDGCTGVIVRNCTINSEDDAMCLKGCSNKPTQNILIENSTFVSTCNALKIGTDTQGPFRRILARNLVLGGIPVSMSSSAGRQASTGITLATVDGGDVGSLWVTDIIINQARCPVFVRVGNRGRVMPGMPRPKPGKLHKAIIGNVTGENNYRQGSFISGIPGYKVNDIVIRNYNISMEGGGSVEMAGAPVAENEAGYPDAHQFSVNGLPAYGFYVRHAQNILLDAVNVTPVSPEARPAFISGGDVENAIANGEPVPGQEILVINYKPKYIQNLKIFSTSPKVKIDSARVGALLYTDRTYMFTELADVIRGAEYICWENDLKSTAKAVLMSFSVSQDGKIFVAHDNRLNKPDWLSAGFLKTTAHFPVPGTDLTLYEKKINRDVEVEFGANQVPGTETGNSTNYIVFFVPQEQTGIGIGDPEKYSGLASAANHYRLNVYPNPAKNSISFRVLKPDYTRIQIYDVLGRQVMEMKQDFTESPIATLHLNLAAGMYFIEFSGAKKPFIKKFIIL